MVLELERDICSKYTSASQSARALTEGWVRKNMFCPRCGNGEIYKFENNQPVADFFCPVCDNEFELKSKNGSFSTKVPDGAYETMISRITSNENPDFFFLSYSKTDLIVNNFSIIPKHFFTPAIIERRAPLSARAKRAGWVGCNILFKDIPFQGRIDIVKDSVCVDRHIVVEQTNRSENLLIKDISSRGWLMDILHCVNQIRTQDFNLQQFYQFESILALKHPDNHNIKAKIRQQLQFLRDKGYIEFRGNGKYRKVMSV
jgi:type II restriction enzyme